MRSSRTLVATAIAAALLVSGCGTDSKQADDATTTTTAAPRTVVDAAAYDARLSNFATALNSAGMITKLSGKGPFTVFAPDNDAFAKLPAARLQALLSEQNKDALSQILNAHVVATRVTEQDFEPQTLKTLSGATLELEQSGDRLSITGPGGNTVAVVGDPIVAANGLVYPVDGLLVADS